ncbi:MAG TPA: hypothetical protein VMS17_07650 [Gemmataceae bacterium]|nr:hypothetical protein [Gemmataceae bacterium]
MKRKTQQGDDRSQLIGFLGVGLDHPDEDKRMTRSDHFVLLGGSAETHERMQDTALRFEEALKQSGKPLSQTPAEKAVEMLREAMEP